MNLSDCKISTVGVVKEIIESEFDDKMLEYGIVPGVNILVVSKAAFGGPIYIAIDSQRIAIRKKEARQIIIE
ncbi:MAG: FeoA family protein [Flavobacteriales bacterium]